mmetsp:Transcript_21650/g.58201  ORF Transcript_21650/g.58201 Transcript_21650/m.58201 type:complete len:226 (-) Transcript_21650:5684-6361(-)
MRPDEPQSVARGAAPARCPLDRAVWADSWGARRGLCGAGGRRQRRRPSAPRGRAPHLLLGGRLGWARHGRAPFAPRRGAAKALAGSTATTAAARVVCCPKPRCLCAQLGGRPRLPDGLGRARTAAHRGRQAFQGPRGCHQTLWRRRSTTVSCRQPCDAGDRDSPEAPGIRPRWLLFRLTARAAAHFHRVARPSRRGHSKGDSAERGGARGALRQVARRLHFPWAL